MFRFFVIPLVGGQLAYVLLSYVLGCCIARGSRILMPRLFTWVDLTITSTVSVFVGPATGVARVFFSLVWALLACSVLAFPVLPGWAASFDGGFNAHGGMLKAVFSWVLDQENELRQGALAKDEDSD